MENLYIATKTVLLLMRSMLLNLKIKIRVYKHFSLFLQEGQYLDSIEAISIGNSFSMSPGCKLLARENNAKIFIENNVALNFNVMINADFGGKIYIKNNVMIGPNVVIRASDHIISNNNIYSNTGHEPGIITINENVWIASNVVIGKNVEIGANSIIGAGSVVLSDIPSNSIAAGVPARVLRKL